MYPGAPQSTLNGRGLSGIETVAGFWCGFAPYRRVRNWSPSPAYFFLKNSEMAVSYDAVCSNAFNA
jgi:hypothetical protein